MKALPVLDVGRKLTGIISVAGILKAICRSRNSRIIETGLFSVSRPCVDGQGGGRFATAKGIYEPSLTDGDLKEE